ncbi:MAG: rod shape-determining protein MreD [Acidimicrobiia bacterium]
MHLRTSLIIGVVLLGAVLVQTTLFGQLRIVSPDLVLLVAILLTLTRIRPEAILGIAFGAGLVVDLLGSSVLGLRAVVFSTVAYAAIRTREQAEIGRLATALWAGVLSLAGVVMLLVLATLFGQSSLLGPDLARSLLVVPVANLVLAALFAPGFVRLVDHDTTAYRFT